MSGECPDKNNSACQDDATQVNILPITTSTKASKTEVHDKPTQTAQQLPSDEPQPGVPAPTEVGATASSLVDLATASGSATLSDGTVVAATTSASPSKSSSGSNGVSKGAVAGIAVGTAIIGAAIAFIIAFILFKRRKRSTAMSKYDSSPELVSLSKAPNSYVQDMATVPVSNAAIAGAGKRDLDLANMSNSSDFLAGVLPPAANETTVKQKVSMLFDQIQQHVESFYRDVHANILPSMEDDLSKFGTGSVGIVELLQGSSEPTTAIKHALVAYVLNLTSPDSSEGTSLFPRNVASAGANMQEYSSTPDLAAAYIMHRRLAAHLHTSTSNAQARQHDVREAAEHFALVFFPWANPGYNDSEKDEDLVQLINNALDLELWLYGQPYVYEYLWEGVGRRGTVIAPGLAKVTDAKGRIIGQPQVLLEPVVLSN